MWTIDSVFEQVLLLLLAACVIYGAVEVAWRLGDRFWSRQRRRHR